MNLTTDKNDRKERPIARGVLDYFGNALAEVAYVSFIGNKQHNPGEELHWAKDKSTDHADCIVRHLIERGTLDDDGMRHTAKAAWRALALLQIELENTLERANTVESINRNDAENVAFHVGPLPQGVYPIYVSRHDDFNDPATWQQETETVAAINGSGNIEVTGDYEYDQARSLASNPVKETAYDARATVEQMTPPSKRHRLDVPKPGRRMPFEEAREYVFDKYHETFRMPAQRDTRFFDPASLYKILSSFGVGQKVAYQIIGGATFTPNYEPLGYDKFVYIAGPMRGYDLFNFPAFDRARDLFVYGRPGFNVISPADIDRADNPDAANQPAGDQKVYAYRDFATLLMLAYTGMGHIAMLPGWEKSTGAVAEFFLSRWLGLKILDAESTQSLNLSKIKWEDITLTTQQYLSRQLTK